jgi:uncharacterized protein (DUF1800 family)
MLSVQKFFATFAFAFMLAAVPGFGQTSPGSALSARAAARFLDQAIWGPTPASIAQVQTLGIDAWLAQQFALNTSDLPDQPLLNSTGGTNTAMGPIDSAFFVNAVTGNDQLRQRVALALSEIWVVSQVSVPNAYAFPPYWRILRDNAFGNYRDIINAVTLNPAMGTYLNMANNNKGNSLVAANENYARELMQLFTLGLTQLNPDGSPVLNSNGNPVPTYTPAIIPEMAAVFTGWTYPTAPGATAKNNNPAYYFGQMIAAAPNHDETAKTIFNNITIPAGQTAQQDLTSVINALMSHPTMAPFISQQLIQHLVTSNPSPAYIKRVSSVFSNDGTGTAGNMQAVITAILTDPEARAADDPNAPANPSFGHLREPVLFMTNLLRGLNGTLGANSAINNQTTSLSQNLFNAPTVFSYFSPLNVTEKGLLGPEFEIYSTQTASTRADLVNTILYGTLDKSTTVDLTPFSNVASNIDTLLNTISAVFLHDGMSSSLYKAAYTAAAAQTTAKAAAQAALYVVLTSGEYQVIQ